MKEEGQALLLQQNLLSNRGLRTGDMRRQKEEEQWSTQMTQGPYSFWTSISRFPDRIPCIQCHWRQTGMSWMLSSIISPNATNYNRLTISNNYHARYSYSWNDNLPFWLNFSSKYLILPSQQISWLLSPNIASFYRLK